MHPDEVEHGDADSSRAVAGVSGLGSPGCAGATLGEDVQPLRGWETAGCRAPAWLAAAVLVASERPSA